jgi:hypothetical protein
MQTFKEYDQWYIDGKKVTGINVSERCYESTRQREVFTYTIAKRLASLHYVDKVESRLLYKLLTADKAVDASDLLASWPKGGEELGPYARKIASVEEANLLTKVLNTIRENMPLLTEVINYTRERR